MKEVIFELIENTKLADKVYKAVLAGDTSAITAPGQFVDIKLDGFFLRRPISVCDSSNGKLTLIYKVVGSGTEALSGYETGKRLGLLTGLGNGYAIAKCGSMPVVIGGGAGVPPMYMLAKELIKAGKIPSAILGFNTRNEVFFEREFRALGIPVIVTTVDGSYGTKGFVTDAMKDIPFDSTCACGPEPMLKAVYNATDKPGQFSFEERMGCGFGACMGCSCKTKYGNKRICKDGPVLYREEIIW